ncbi:hypothetical protein AURDEDRAFT_176744 [Auricularia subglabra TFB-10046 SS5]|uniref:Uncharacterized protein n=1 Tax=Auricularia subglabra (strain TFB-10046 / SS5) TaxID=717982 RepID=J0WQN0_AURST|nr:hypothetical protein AURDEDRAFT_176744 [Auricularia subglabra TFB-10046 SS5]
MPKVNVAHPLTERAWSMMKRRLLSLLETLRIQLDSELLEAAIMRRKMATEEFVVTHCAVLGNIGPVMPSPADYAEFPVLQDLLDPALEQDPSRERLLQEQLLSTFQQSLVLWRDSLAIRIFDSVFPNEIDMALNDKMCKLNLATTFFNCSRRFCAGLLKDMRYPTVLGHSCLTGGNPCTPWSEESIVLDPVVGDLLANILRSCCMDPTVTTHDELVECDPRVFVTSFLSSSVLSSFVVIFLFPLLFFF